MRKNLRILVLHTQLQIFIEIFGIGFQENQVNILYHEIQNHLE